MLNKTKKSKSNKPKKEKSRICSKRAPFIRDSNKNCKKKKRMMNQLSIRNYQKCRLRFMRKKLLLLRIIKRSQIKKIK